MDPVGIALRRDSSHDSSRGTDIAAEMISLARARVLSQFWAFYSSELLRKLLRTIKIAMTVNVIVHFCPGLNHRTFLADVAVGYRKYIFYSAGAVTQPLYRNVDAASVNDPPLLTETPTSHDSARMRTSSYAGHCISIGTVVYTQRN